MTIAFLHTSFDGAGGAERFISTWAQYLEAKGHQVVLIGICPSKQPRFALPKGIRWVHLDFPRKGHSLLKPLIAYKLHRTVQREGIDILLAQSPKACCLLAWASKFFPLPSIGMEHLSFQAGIMSGKQQKERAQYYRYLKAFVCLTPEDVAPYQQMGISHVVQIYNPLTDFHPNQPDHAHPLLLSVGRQSREKNHEALLRVFHTVQQSIPQARLSIVGQDEGERPKLQRMADELGISSAVAFIDFTTDIQAIYRQASLLLLTSHTEGLPLTLLEAKSHGIPCISFDCPTGPRYIIQHGIDGYLVPLYQEEEMADRTIFLLQQPAISASMGAKGLEDAQERFHIDKLYTKWLQLFQTVLASKKS